MKYNAKMWSCKSMSNSVGIYFFHVNNNLVFATGSLEYDYQGTYLCIKCNHTFVQCTLVYVCFIDMI